MDNLGDSCGLAAHTCWKHRRFALAFRCVARRLLGGTKGGWRGTGSRGTAHSLPNLSHSSLPFQLVLREQRSTQSFLLSSFSTAITILPNCPPAFISLNPSSAFSSPSIVKETTGRISCSAMNATAFLNSSNDPIVDPAHTSEQGGEEGEKKRTFEFTVLEDEAHADLDVNSGRAAVAREDSTVFHHLRAALVLPFPRGGKTHSSDLVRDRSSAGIDDGVEVGSVLREKSSEGLGPGG